MFLYQNLYDIQADTTKGIIKFHFAEYKNQYAQGHSYEADNWYRTYCKNQANSGYAKMHKKKMYDSK